MPNKQIIKKHNYFTDWRSLPSRCIECVKASPYLELANELEITKAITYLKEKDLAKVCKSNFKKALTTSLHSVLSARVFENPGDCQKLLSAM